MKKFVFTIALLLSVASVCFAQEQKVSVVELKNGSTIRGLLLESSEGTIKVQTADKSVFVYPLSDVKGITETNQVYKSAGLDSRGPQKGKYRGFADFEFGFATPHYGWNSLGIETSHGYQLLDWLYLGGGVGVQVDFLKSLFYPSRKESPYTWAVPIFADFRIDLLNNSISPYFDARIGYNVLKSDYESGIYLNPNIGCRFVVGKLPLNASIGMNLYNPSHGFKMAISIRAGIEF